MCHTRAGAEKAERPLWGKVSRPLLKLWEATFQACTLHSHVSSLGLRDTDRLGQKKAPGLRVGKERLSGCPLPAQAPHALAVVPIKTHLWQQWAVMAGKANSWELKMQTESRRISQEGGLQKNQVMPMKNVWRTEAKLLMLIMSGRADLQGTFTL